MNLESFKYYLQMPAYIYPKSERIVKMGFMTFVINSAIVIGFAMIAQVLLCSICAFVISRQLSPRAAKFVLMFFLGGMMILSPVLCCRSSSCIGIWEHTIIMLHYCCHFYIHMGSMCTCIKAFLTRFREVILRLQLLTEQVADTCIPEFVCRYQNLSFH